MGWWGSGVLRPLDGFSFDADRCCGPGSLLSCPQARQSAVDTTDQAPGRVAAVLDRRSEHACNCGLNEADKVSGSGTSALAIDTPQRHGQSAGNKHLLRRRCVPYERDSATALCANSIDGQSGHITCAGASCSEWS